MIDLSLISGFDWNDGNARKNEKHGVGQSDAEEVAHHFHPAPGRFADSRDLGPGHAQEGKNHL